MEITKMHMHLMQNVTMPPKKREKKGGKFCVEESIRYNDSRSLVCKPKRI